MPDALADYDFPLPPSLIAQHPATPRESARLLTPEDGKIRAVADLPNLLKSGDLLVVNNSRVLPARLVGEKKGGGRAEILAERFLPGGEVVAQMRGKGLKTGAAVAVAGGGSFVVVGREKEFYILAFYRRGARAAARGIFLRYGQTPLPPYIKRAAADDDKERYQTLYARRLGSVAAPTAGLHFSNELLRAVKSRGVDIVAVTLHVGAGTFSPIRGDIASHKLHAECYRVGARAAAAVNRAKRQGGRIVAVGTTVLRVLETAINDDGRLVAGGGETNLFIRPGYCFRGADCLLTNFHLPRSSLLILVCAFGGHEKIMRAYRRAARQKMRFYSYGDAMFLCRGEHEI